MAFKRNKRNKGGEMRKAKDGKLFDIDNLIVDTSETDVEVIQSLYPDGKRRRMFASVGKELAQIAQEMIISAEELKGGNIAIYVRNQGEPEVNELLEIATNGPGKNSPIETLKRLIKKQSEQAKKRRKDETAK